MAQTGFAGARLEPPSGLNERIRPTPNVRERERQELIHAKLKEDRENS